MVCCSKLFTETYLVALQNVIFINKTQQPIILGEIKEFTKTAVDYVAVVIWVSRFGDWCYYSPRPLQFVESY